jgi:hypothetical protein
LLHPLDTAAGLGTLAGEISADPSGVASSIWGSLQTSEGIGNAVGGIEAGLAAGGFVAALSPEAAASGLTASDVSATLTKADRLEITFSQLDSAPAATSANEAMAQLNNTLEGVEDEFSGVPKDPNPPRTSTPRMYPATGNSIVTGPDGSITTTSAGHITIYGPDGSITVVQKGSDAIVFKKPGGG